MILTGASMETEDLDLTGAPFVETTDKGFIRSSGILLEASTSDPACS